MSCCVAQNVLGTGPWPCLYLPSIQLCVLVAVILNVLTERLFHNAPSSAIIELAGILLKQLSRGRRATQMRKCPRSASALDAACMACCRAQRWEEVGTMMHFASRQLQFNRDCKKRIVAQFMYTPAASIYSSSCVCLYIYIYFPVKTGHSGRRSGWRTSSWSSRGQGNVWKSWRP